ncbi:uncharacterized protein [Arachis hypogaea]|uniref:uncharacterized protein n=1 Tax=Arachis hypogaea TaxID=3818 RepID=UPI003B212D6C
MALKGKLLSALFLLCIYGLNQDLGIKLVFKGSDLVDHWKTSSVTSSWLSDKLKKSEAKVLKAVYFPNEDFKVSKAGKGASWIWKSIVHGKDFLLRNGRWLIGNGDKVRILEDNWILNMNKRPVIMSNDVTFVKELISVGQGWNVSELRKHFDGDTIGKIIRTPVSVIGREDKFSWPLKEDGKYTVKTGYHVARKEQHINDSSVPSTSDDFNDLWRDIWKLKVPQKIRTFLWREPESTEHALLLCPWTRAAWFGAQIQCCPTAHTVTSFGKWIMDLFEKMKVCTAFLEVFSGGATAAVLRDHVGNLLTASNSRIAASSPLAAEALAVREAVILAQNFQLQRVIFESDSLKLIQALKSKASIAEIQVILDDILDLVRNISNFGFTWVPREGNALAHEVAKLTAHGSLGQNWPSCKPQSVMNILNEERCLSLHWASRS